MLDYIKRLITPDMVSFWVPSGLNRAQDLIRGNHGQCYGTHPNVPVLPALINPSVGWHFDSVDDFIDCGNHASLAVTQWTIGMWLYRKTDSGLNERLLAKSDASLWDWYFQISDADTLQISFKDTDGNSHFVLTIETVPTVEWIHAVTTFDGTYEKIYMDAVLKRTSADFSAFTPRTSTRNLWLGKMLTSYDFNGYIALPFVANQAWSQAQIDNFYLQTKGFFWPRG